MRVIDIMTATVRTALPTTSVMAALRTLAEAHVSSLPVVDDEGALVGIVSEKDLLRRVIDPPTSKLTPGQLRDTPPTQVQDVMTPDPHTVRPETDVADVAHVFSIMAWKSVPVVRDDRLVGVISRSDVVRALTREDRAVQRDLERLCANAGHAEWRVTVSDGIAEVAGPRDAQERAEANRLARSVVGVRRVQHPSADPGSMAP